MNHQTKDRIREHLAHVLERLIDRRVNTEPFNAEEIRRNNPFGFRLVPIEVWKGSKFERSFVTTLGQGIFEQLAKFIAEGTGSVAENQHTTKMTICTFRLEKIDSILTGHREKKKSPNWSREVAEVLALENERFEEVSIKSDLFIQRPSGKKEYYSLKTVKPNLDQTERAKRDMLRLRAGDPDCEAYFALPFNPDGDGENYTFSIPFKIFDMNQDDCVLIGSELWNKIGADENTYTELLNIFDEVGSHYSEIIRRDYFGL